MWKWLFGKVNFYFDADGVPGGGDNPPATPPPSVVPPEGDPPATPPDTPDTPEPEPAWHEGFAPGIADNRPNFGEFATPEDFVNKYLESTTKLTELETRQAEMAPPADPSGYQFTRIDDYPYDEDVVGDLQRVAHEAGISNKQFSAIMDFHNKIVADTSKKVSDNRNQAIQTLQSDWGDNYATNLSQAQLAARAVCTDDTMALLRGSGLGDTPAIVRMFYEISKSLGEDILMKAKGESPAPKPVTRTEGGEVMLDYPSMRGK
ncbi:MAG: hypothetical protein PVJ39_21295 [Gammaproteobacteria bacterium]|jgi:hypothetical protein